jgi:hypothetical protein
MLKPTMTLRVWRAAVLAIGLAGLSGCAAFDATQVRNAPDKGTASEGHRTPGAQISTVKVWEGGCFYQDGCTTYTLTLHRNDSYTLNAANRVRTPGQTSGVLAPGGFAKVEAALAAADFYALPPRLDAQTVPKAAVGPTCMMHAPGLIVTVEHADGTRKEVFWDQGCRSDQGQRLRENLRAAFGFDTLIKPKD